MSVESADWREVLDRIDPTKEKFPDHYSTEYEIKSPLTCLFYNMQTEYRDNYPAKMHPDFARDMILLYSNPDDLVWDGCCGSGTVPREAYRLGRRAIGTDVNPKAIELCKAHQADAERFCAGRHPPVYEVADVKSHVLEEKADLILSSFPFGLSIGGDKNNYSAEVEDMSNSKNFDEYFVHVRRAIHNYYEQLKFGGIMILDGRDRTKESRYFDLINFFRNMAIDVGFKLLCKYHYFSMPWSHYTFFNKESKAIVPMISTMDAIVLFKPKQQILA